jgi:integrase
MGRRHLTKCRVVRREKLLREAVAAAHCAPRPPLNVCEAVPQIGRRDEQIQFLLGHASVQTTERYLGCKQNLGHPVNDLFIRVCRGKIR